MRILYIGDRQMGGIRRHVQCLCAALPKEVLAYAIGEDEPFAGTSGHDVREWRQIRRVVREFRPNVIHFHIANFLMALYVRLFVPRTVKIFCTWHTPTTGSPSFGQRVFLRLLGSRCTFLPVSTPTAEGFRHWLPKAKVEVVYNPVRIEAVKEKGEGEWRNDSPFVVGMVGRAADQKDWPSFCSVADKLERRVGVGERRDKVRFWGVGVGEDESKSFGPSAEKVEWKGLQPNGREWIGKMDLFVMTSKHEELPTTLLECFAERTPVCGFLPCGGVSEILSFSNGSLREVFLSERNPARLVAVVQRLADDANARRRLVEDGWQIVTRHFDVAVVIRRLLALYGKNMV